MIKKLLQKLFLSLFPQGATDQMLDEWAKYPSLTREEMESRIWDEKQEKEHDEIEKRTGIRPLKWRPNEFKSNV